MKTLINLLALAIIAANITACGMVDDSDSQDHPVIVTTDELEDSESSFEGVYQGTSTVVNSYTFGDAEYGGSDIGDTQVSITPSKNGGLLMTGVFAANCPFRATDHGDWIEVASQCTDIQSLDGTKVRVEYHLEGEGEFTNSGKLSLDLHGTESYAIEVHTDDGTRWEEAGSGEVTIDFSGRAL